MHMYRCIHGCMDVLMNMYGCQCFDVCVCMDVWMYACMYGCIDVYALMYVYMNVCICMHMCFMDANVCMYGCIESLMYIWM